MSNYVQVTQKDIQDLAKKLDEFGGKLSEKEATILMGVLSLAEKSLAAGNVQGSGAANTPSATTGSGADVATQRDSAHASSSAPPAVGGGAAAGGQTTAASAPAAASAAHGDAIPKKKLSLERSALRHLSIWDQLLSVEAHSLWTCNGKPVIPGEEVKNQRHK